MDFADILGLINSVLKTNSQNGNKIDEIQLLSNDVFSEYSLIPKEPEKTKMPRDVTVNENILQRFNDVAQLLSRNKSLDMRKPEVHGCSQLQLEQLYQTDNELERKIDRIKRFG